MLRRRIMTKDTYTGLKFTALAAGTFSFNIASGLNTSNLEYVEYSIDGGVNWTRTNNIINEAVVITTPTINAGKEVWWRGKGIRITTSNSGDASSYSRFTATADFEASGNVMSLLYEDWDNATSVSSYAFAFLFYHNNKIKKAPEFPATTVASHCYTNTFRNCTRLVNGPTIFPAKTLENNCYNSCFRGCSSLVAAPILPAKTLLTNCYIYMFRECSSLNYIKALFTTTPGINTSYTSAWVNGVAATGTFVKNPAATWTTVGQNGVPTGWTVQYDYPKIDGHEYVDLGLPSGTKWATMNVGASSETDYGNYYQYGKGAAQYAATSGDSNYGGTEDPLDSSVDTAVQVWGGSWHMPTRAQMQELTANTTYQWVTNYKGSGINGGTFTATNGAVLFIPAAGLWSNGSLSDVGDYGYCWGSSPMGVSACSLFFNDGLKDVYDGGRKYGYSVRPVVG